jgi:hypothetical protein
MVMRDNSEFIQRKPSPRGSHGQAPFIAQPLHLKAHRAAPAFENAAPESRHNPVRIHSGQDKPANALAAVRYREHWFWVDDGDWQTKRALVNHIWSFAGESGRAEVNATFLQPFVSYTTKTFTTFTLNTESTYDWPGHQWSVPVNFMVQQLVKIGKQPVAFTLGSRYYAEGPSNGPDWGLRFAVILLFPK